MGVHHRGSLGRGSLDRRHSVQRDLTGAQTSYLKTLSEQHGWPEAFADDLTKAEASKRIDALKDDDKLPAKGSSPEKRVDVT